MHSSSVASKEFALAAAAYRPSSLSEQKYYPVPKGGRFKIILSPSSDSLPQDSQYELGESPKNQNQKLAEVSHIVWLILKRKKKKERKKEKARLSPDFEYTSSLKEKNLKTCRE